MKLLLFTEHKDTLDFLAGDGRDGRPFGKLIEWKLNVTQIHGGMKVGDRDTPGSRLFAERDFRENAQVLVATEAAGEGINLQFCWFMINYDVPWNFVRLEQRMGRIHRYGQEKDCLILNFVSTNTREGRVIQKIFERVKAAEEDLDPQRTGKVFNVLGDVFPANMLEKMVRDMYAHNQMDEEIIKQRIVEQVDRSRFERITNSTLEGLAKRELNLSAIIGKSAEAKERRLVPEVIEDFFVNAAPIAGVQPKEVREDSHIYRVGRVPRPLWPVGERLEPRFGKLGREYKNVVFDKALLPKDPTLEWVTPGHPLFEAVREDVTDQTTHDLQRGSVFYDLNCKAPYRLDFFAASIKDGLDHQLHRRLFAVQVTPSLNSQLSSINLAIKQPTVLLDLALAPKGTAAPNPAGLPDRAAIEQFLVQNALTSMLAETTAQRLRETTTISQHLEISLGELIERIAVQFVIQHEEAEGRVVESVEKDNRGFDLISRRPHPEDPKTAIDVRFIEVKGRAETGEIALTANEYNTAKRLKKDYWLCVVFHCASEPSLNILRDPSTLDWQPIVKIEHYRLCQDSLKHPVEVREEPPEYRTS